MTVDIEPLTASERRYLKATWYLAQDGTPVTVGQVAERLGVSHASASTTLAQLVDRGALERSAPRGVVLTAAGQRQALGLVRRHRLVETLLADVLGLAWHEVHEEAERLELSISDRVEERIAAVLGDPRRDPHGDPIPPRDGDHHEAREPSLAQVEPGRDVTIVRVSDRDPDLLRYLADQGLELGSTLRVEGQEPFGGPLRVSSEAGTHLLGDQVAAAVSVIPTTPPAREGVSRGDVR